MKALFVPFVPSLAHVSRCLAVAEVWRANGHTAVFAVGAERTELVQDAGFETRTVPGAAVARRSAVVFHHGGHETLMQVLAAGVPSLIWPANPDQILVAQQAQALGIGHSLWQPNGLPMGDRALHAMTSAQIRREIDSLIADQECARTCQSLKQEIEACRGATAAAEILYGIAKARPRSDR